MNEVIKNILTRRSVRSFKPEQITEEQLGAVLKAAVYAPSGGNSQRWIFTAVQNEGVLKKLNGLVRSSFGRLEVDENTYKSKVKGKNASQSPDYSFYYNAPTLVIASNESDYPNAMADCAAAMENMMLAAHSLGLGSCWINQLTWFCTEPDIKSELSALGIPESHVVCGSVALGYSAVSKGGAAPRKEGNVRIIK